ncbi:hypothetical protein [Singulisphaera sp. PoT]|uniref:hypothetical protein n=1 Tax=Singulisphaera sp. PoT TaxID=3411797 RepID=UPI003BF4FFB0
MNSPLSVLSRLVQATGLEAFLLWLLRAVFRPPVPDTPTLPYGMRHVPGVESALAAAAVALVEFGFWSGVFQGFLAGVLCTLLVRHFIVHRSGQQSNT